MGFADAPNGVGEKEEGSGRPKLAAASKSGGSTPSTEERRNDVSAEAVAKKDEEMTAAAAENAVESGVVAVASPANTTATTTKQKMDGPQWVGVGVSSSAAQKEKGLSSAGSTPVPEVPTKRSEPSMRDSSNVHALEKMPEMTQPVLPLMLPSGFAPAGSMHERAAAAVNASLGLKEGEATSADATSTAAAIRAATAEEIDNAATDGESADPHASEAELDGSHSAADATFEDEEALSAYVVPSRGARATSVAARRGFGGGGLGIGIRQDSSERVYEGVSVPKNMGVRSGDRAFCGDGRKLLFACVGVCAVFAGIIAAGVVVSSDRSASDAAEGAETMKGSETEIPVIELPEVSRKPSTISPTASPTHSERFMDVRSAILSLYDESALPLSPAAWTALDDPTSPQFRALSWLANDDFTVIDPATNDNLLGLLQRFVLATLYFSTLGRSSWEFKCNFLSGGSECGWKSPGVPGVHTVFGTNFPFIGVYCEGDNRTVDTLAIVNNNMTGVLPEELGLLTHLQAIAFSGNSIGGPLPSSILQMPRLEYLYLHDNRLTQALPSISPDWEGSPTRLRSLFLFANDFHSSIPSSLSLLSNLTSLYLAHNDLTGTVPSELGRLTELRTLVLDSNGLNGTLNFPPERTLPNLESLSVKSNFLSGSFPHEALGQMTNLRALNLYDNYLSGRLPPDVRELRSLTQLVLNFNIFTGPIPEGLWELDQMTFLSLAQNGFNGTLSSGLGNMTRLQQLALGQNSLSGSVPEDLGERLGDLAVLNIWSNDLTSVIPSSVGLMTNLQVLWLSWNRLVGTVPRTFANLSSLALLSIDGNDLTGEIDFLCDVGIDLIEADCHGPDEKVQCSCCGRCCDEDRVCVPPRGSSGVR